MSTQEKTESSSSSSSASSDSGAGTNNNTINNNNNNYNGGVGGRGRGYNHHHQQHQAHMPPLQPIHPETMNMNIQLNMQHAAKQKTMKLMNIIRKSEHTKYILRAFSVVEFRLSPS